MTMQVKEGQGCLSRGEGPLWDIRYHFQDVNPAGPVCIMMPGFRSRGMESTSNQALHHAVADAGVSVVSFDYAGCENLKWNVDPLTMDSMMKDTIAIMNGIGGRDHILLSKSMAVNVALAAADDNTRGIVAAVPAHDFIQRTCLHFLHKKHPLVQKAALFGLFSFPGFYMWKPNSNYSDTPYVKITGNFVKNSDNFTLAEIFKKTQVRPSVSLIGQDKDRVAMPEMLEELRSVLHENSYRVDMTVTPGNGHTPQPPALSACAQRVLEYAQ